MNRWLLIGSMACLLVVSTGCRMGCGAGGCGSGACNPSYGECGTGNAGGCNDCGPSGPVGLLGKLKAHCCCGGCSDGCGKGILGRMCGMCLSGGSSAGCGSGHAGCQGGCGSGACGGRPGCQAGPLGWQQGGLDYSSHLQPGLIGHDAPAALNNRPFTPGPPSAQVAYPYYTHKGPRDFLLDNPPTIGR